MNYMADDAFFLMVFVLPSLFGITLMGEGVRKVMSSEGSGYFTIFTGFIFLSMVVFAYFYIQSINF